MNVNRQITKEELRSLLKEEGARFRNENSSGGGLSALTSRILAELEGSEEFRNAAAVLLYASIEDEVPTLDFIRKWSSVKTIVLPRVVSDSDMELRKFNPDNVRRGAFGILEPDDSCEIVDIHDIDLAIIPGVAFAPVVSSPKGGKGGYARLGRGKGYYDRLLSKLSCPKIGLCYPFQLVDYIPQEAWDVPVDNVGSLPKVRARMARNGSVD